MLSFYSFGQALEKYILPDVCVLPKGTLLFYVLLYFGGIVVSIIPSFLKQKDNEDYYSLGASGGVSSIVFATVLFFPQMELGFMFVPVPIPGYIFCFIYLAISYYLDKRGGGNINHSAHISGALFGLAFTYAAVTVFGNIDLIENFKLQLSEPNHQLVPFQCK
jgi:membrane associated rhomboid family serine protease